MDESGSDKLLVAMVGTVGVADSVGFTGGVGFTVPFFKQTWENVQRHPMGKTNDNIITQYSH